MEGPAFREFADKVHSCSICVEQEALDGTLRLREFSFKVHRNI
jgi:hypothetical protein